MRAIWNRIRVFLRGPSAEEIDRHLDHLRRTESRRAEADPAVIPSVRHRRGLEG